MLVLINIIYLSMYKNDIAIYHAKPNPSDPSLIANIRYF